MIDTSRIAATLNAVLEINADDTPRVADFEYSGAVKGIYVSVYPNGYFYGKENRSINYTTYPDTDRVFNKFSNGETKFLESFEQWIEDMKKGEENDTV